MIADDSVERTCAPPKNGARLVARAILNMEADGNERGAECPLWVDTVEKLKKEKETKSRRRPGEPGSWHSNAL
jgi:hypothetical protein